MKLHSLVPLALLLLAGAPLHAESATTLVSQIHVRDAGSFTHGDTYAKDLYAGLTAKGIKAYLILFNWGDYRESQNTAAFVVFKDEEGRYWGKQSIDFHCKWLPGTTPQEWAEAFYQSKRVQLISAQENTVASGDEIADNAPASTDTATP